MDGVTEEDESGSTLMKRGALGARGSGQSVSFPTWPATGTSGIWNRTARVTSAMTTVRGTCTCKTSEFVWLQSNSSLNDSRKLFTCSYSSSYADEVPLSTSMEKYVYRRDKSGTSPKMGHFFLDRFEPTQLSSGETTFIISLKSLGCPKNSAIFSIFQ